MTKAPLIAAIDVGTNSFHMVIGSVNHRGMLRIKSRDKEMVRLGSSGGDMKRLLPDAIERGVKTLKMFAGIAVSEKAEIRAVATSAVREANNQSEFLDRVKNEIGFDIEVISGQEEGRLIHLGVTHALPINRKKGLIIDIGGGSTETIIGYKNDILHVNSVKLGAIRLSKRFFPDGISTSQRIKQCREYIKGEWAPTMKHVQEIGFDSVVGTAGTITNIALMSIISKGSDEPDMINGITVKLDELLATIDKILSAKKIADRQKLDGIDSNRADIILGGALILEHAILELNIQKLFLSAYALREGIVFDTVRKHQAIEQFHELTDLRFNSVYNICRQFGVDLVHAEYVKKIALQLFDDLQSIHKLGYAERELLEASTLLHDVGYHISHDQHHKHSYYLILNCMMPGFTNSEAEVIANVARYHRKSHPKKKHENFAKLTPDKQNVVKILAGILRIAEGIDRRQQQVVSNVRAYSGKMGIRIELHRNTDSLAPDIELWGAERRKPLLEEALGQQIIFKIVNSQ